MRCALLLLLTTGILWLGYWANRSDFGSLFGAYSFTFAAYFTFLLLPNRLGAGWLIAIGLALRLLLLFGLPVLSDDIYRFIWDGQLTIQGIHPFAFTPEEIMKQGHGNAALYPLLNSPRYFTVYPPVNQGIFWLAAKCCPDYLSGSVFIIKSFLFLGEAGTLWVLYRFLKTIYPEHLNRGIAVYALNPLVIVETVGNCHFEGMMTGCLILALLSLHRKNPAWAGAWWAISVAVKLLPALFVPLVLGWLDNRSDRRSFLSALALAGLLLFLPLLDWQVMLHLAKSVRLYFQQFEFNASLYYLFSHLSPWFTGWYEGRIISIVLAEVTVGVTLGLSWRLWYKMEKSTIDLHKALFWTAFIYLINATTVHPWYVVVPFMLGTGTRYLSPVVWTWAVVLSYSHYHHGAYLENYWLIALEYMILAACLIWDLRQKGHS